MAVTINGSGTIGGLSAYQQGAGLTLITSSTFSAASSVSVDNCFTSTYDNYRVTLKVTAATGSDVEMSMRFRSLGANISTANYRYAFLQGRASDGNTSTAWSSGVAQFHVGKTPTSGGDPRLNVSMDVFSPAAAVSTGITTTLFKMLNGSEFFGSAGGGVFDATTTFDGISFYPASGTFTGTLRVYGYTN